jgi:hypothetical protein
MTDMSVAAASFAEREFRVGAAMSKAMTVLSRNVLTFGIVTLIASLPNVLFFNRQNPLVGNPALVGWIFASAALFVVLNGLTQAVVLYGAFEDMRGRPVDILASLGRAWRRFVPVIGTSFMVILLAGLASILLIIPGVMLFTMWFVAIPACVVEQIGPWKSLDRSEALTKGNRWKLFGIMLLLGIVSVVGDALMGALTVAAGMTIGILGSLIWSALVDAFSATLVVVIYHDLRVAKEGVDTDQISAVFK